jgi:hypothetical protein
MVANTTIATTLSLQLSVLQHHWSSLLHLVATPHAIATCPLYGVPSLKHIVTDIIVTPGDESNLLQFVDLATK